MTNSGVPRSRDNWNAISNALHSVGPFTYTIDFGDHTDVYKDSFDDTLCGEQIPDLHQFEDWIHTPIRGTHRYPPGDCDHIAAKFPILPSIVDFTIYGGDPVTSAEVKFFSDDENCPEVLMPIGRGSIAHTLLQSGELLAQSAVPGSTLDNLNLEAFNYFSTVFPQELSTGEFLQGFTQMRQLLPELKDSIVSTLSGGFLTKEFGWDNLLSDLKSISGILDGVRRRMESLKKTYGIPTRLSFVRYNVHKLNYDYDHYTANEPVLFGNLCGSRIVLTSFHVNYRATAWITQMLDFLDDVMGWIRAIAMSLGLDNPIKAFWQTLPFSFIIDWFLNVSGHLDALTRARPSVGWDINSITHSLKYEFEFELQTIAQPNTTYDSVLQSVPLSVSRFYRRLDLPFDLGLLDLSELSTHQQLLLIALGLA